MLNLNSKYLLSQTNCEWVAVFLTQYDTAFTPHKSTKTVVEEFTWQHSHSVTEPSTGTRTFMAFKTWTDIRFLFSRSLEFFDLHVYINSLQAMM
jgi:hypothetical protein